ncbi:MAG: type VI secretion system ATPase TssH [Deltaproteobacteria bacterium]|nr:type VI secretion system ATPase TssH [Deltaproteobacteria bacterium]MBW1928443.1 type VI secretion system ATPase TssH [Deltaproteobacteria bacterium]MBW2024222.1 type VI secretion system ATPase TssH [Deltaproteobacteria bacterium]MBW2125073.1 type VI secretion system ATPase TssH [Deltaproteobacteria bacterium]
MVSVDIKALLNRLNTYCTRCLEGAAGLCVSRTHYEVTIEHLLSKLLEEPQSDLPLIFRQFDLDSGRVKKAIDQTIEEFRTGNAAKPVFSPLLMELFQEAWLTSSVDLGENRIRSGALLAAFLNKPTQFAMGAYVDLFSSISREALLAQFGAIVKNSIEEPTAEERAAVREEAPAGEGTALARFCVDFTEKARAGEIDPVFGRDREIRQMVDILARRRKNNPIVVGEAGVGKTAVVEGLALRVVEGDVPELLRDVSILGLDMGLLQAGAGVKGEFENRLKSVINEIKASPKPIILFIDEAHTLIGAGGSAGGSDAANLLKPALARGELRTVAATTWSEYKKYFEKDAALARRFQLVKLDEPSVETATLILRGLKEKYEEAHGVVVRDDAIEAASELSSRYISGRQLPDKAVDLLDTSAARVKILLTAKPDVIEDKERTVQALEREKRALERDQLHGLEIDQERMTEINTQLEQLNKELEELKDRWLKEKELAQQLIELRKSLYEKGSEEEASSREELKKQIEGIKQQLESIQGDSPLVRIEVDPDVVAKVVSDWTGIPLGKVMRDEASNIINLEANLKERIKGQDEAIETIAQVIRAGKSGLKDPAQPLGVFLLVGPSGVGKTETGLAVADLLFGGERYMVTINMSEFQERHTVSRLIGSPPGYVGYGEGGVLTEAVRQRPYSVVLLDEVEKAHLEVLNLFYQVFDKGMLSDGEGRVIDFKNTVVFLTSNLATDVITEMCSGEERLPLETLMAAIRPILSDHFKPALLARMTVVPFYTLGPDILKDIVVLKLDKLAKRMAESHKIKLTYSPKVVEQIASRCTEVETGARNIDHIMNGTILPQMSREILARLSEGAMPSETKLDVDKAGTFKITFGG